MTEQDILTLTEKLKTEFGQAAIVRAITPFIELVSLLIDDLDKKGHTWQIFNTHSFSAGSSICFMPTDNRITPDHNFVLKSRDGVHIDLYYQGIRTPLKIEKNIVSQIELLCRPDQ